LNQNASCVLWLRTALNHRGPEGSLPDSLCLMMSLLLALLLLHHSDVLVFDVSTSLVGDPHEPLVGP
jgi:hypothetical protein